MFILLPLIMSLVITKFVFYFLPHRASWVGTGIPLCQFLRIFLFTFGSNSMTRIIGTRPISNVSGSY